MKDIIPEAGNLIKENENLKNKLVQREAELALISSVSEAISKQLDIEKITRIIGDKVKEIFNSEVTEILLLDEATNMINVPYSFYRDYQTAEPFPFGEGLTSLILKAGKALILGTYEEAEKLGAIIQSEEEKTETYIGMPIIVHDKVIGVVSIQSYKINDYDDEKIRLLSILSTNMGIALQNAKMFDETKKLLNETEQRTAELSVINSVQEGLASELEINGIYELVGEKIREIFNAQVIDIVTYDKLSNKISDCYAYEKGDRTLLGPRALQGFRKYVIETMKPLMINKDVDKEMIKYDNVVAIGEKTKSNIFVPMIVGDEVTGVISLQNLDKENAFNDSDVRLLTTLANSMSIALENARLFDETNKLLEKTKQQAVELGIINSVGEGLAKQLDFQTIVDLVGEKIRNVFNAQIVSISTYDSENDNIHHRYVVEKSDRFYFDKPQNIDSRRKEIVKTKRPLIFGSKHELIEYSGNEVIAGDMPESFMGVPIIHNQKVTGVITVQDLDRQNLYSEKDVRLLLTLASNMGVALQNAKLFEETNKLLEETKQQAIELGIINSVGDGLAKQLDFQSIIDLVGEKIREVFNAQVVTISSYNKDTKEIHHRFALELNERYYFDKPQPVDVDRKEIIETKQPLVFRSAQEAIEHSGDEVAFGEMPESFMGVPIFRNQEVTGVITVQDIHKINLYGDKEVRLLMTLASNMGVALENARLFEETKRLLNETQQRNVELSILNAIQEGLVMEMDFNSIINLVGDKFREALGFLDLGIRIYDKEKNILHFPYEYEHGERLYIESMEPTPLSKYVLETGKTLILKKATEEEFAKLGITENTTIPGTDSSKSLVFVPIIVGTQAKGLILIENYEKEDAFSESEIRLLTTVANSMSVALENARLFDETTRLLKETEQRTAELSVINSVQEGLAKELDIVNIYNLVGDRLCSLFPDSQTLVIRTFNHNAGLEEWQYAMEKGVRLEVEPRKFNWANKLLIETKKHIDIRENYLETAQKYGGTGVTKGLPPKSAVFVPMIAGDVVIGSISLQNTDKENAFNESDVRLITTVANSMSVALENARLFDETLRLLEGSKKRAAEMETVNSISRAIAGHLEIDKLINLVGEKVRSLFNANIVYLALLDKDKEMIEFPYGYGDTYPPLKLGDGLTSRIILKKEPLLINKETDREKVGLGEKRIGTPSASFLGVPIPVGDEIIGVLSVQSTEKENVFNEDDMRLLGTIAAHVGIAINNANAYEELNKTLENLKATQNQLVAQEKLASLGQLTAGIAHEIKNPLNFVNNFSELSVQLVDELNEELSKIDKSIDKEVYDEIFEILETLKQNSEKIKEHGKRADSIVHSMLQHSRGKTGEKQPVDINAMLDEDINLVYHGMRAQDSSFNITIEKDYDKNLGDLNAIPQDLSRVFLNILTNGCYEAYRKKVELKTEELATISIQTIGTDKEIEIRIKDNGFGIPEKIRDHLFTPFFTTKPTGKGTGLGLSISYDIVVSEHHGDLLFETEEGKYTEFIIRLPKNSKH